MKLFLDNTQISYLRVSSVSSFPPADFSLADHFSFPVVVEERAEFVANEGVEGFRSVSIVGFNKSTLPLEIDVLVQDVVMLLVVLTLPRLVWINSKFSRPPESHHDLVRTNQRPAVASCYRIQWLKCQSIVRRC